MEDTFTINQGAVFEKSNIEYTVVQQIMGNLGMGIEGPDCLWVIKRKYDPASTGFGVKLPWFMVARKIG